MVLGSVIGVVPASVVVVSITGVVPASPSDSVVVVSMTGVVSASASETSEIPVPIEYSIELAAEIAAHESPPWLNPHPDSTSSPPTIAQREMEHLR